MTVDGILNGVLRYALRISQNSVGNPFDKSNAAGIVKIIRDFQGSGILASQTPVDARREQKSDGGGWIRTAERAPTNKDADLFGKVYAHTKEGRSFTVDWTNFYWHNEGIRLLDDAVKNWPFWMPIPKSPNEISDKS